MKLRNGSFAAGVIAGMMLCALRESGALELGEPAPSVRVGRWVNGAPVDFARSRGSNVFVVDFWATTCAACRYTIPYLSEMQKKYRDRGVVIVGISSEPADKVTSSLSKLGSPVGYSMAIDPGGKTSDSYLKGIGLEELPHAFVIDKDGKLVWHGNSTVALDQVLAEVLAGKLELESARQSIAAEKLIREYYLITSTGINNPRGAELGDQILASASKYPSILNEFAWRILTDHKIRTKDYKLALRASEAAYQLSEKTVPVMDTYARALFQNGRHAEAIEMEKKAIAACDDTRFRPELESILLRFQRLSRTNANKGK